MKLLTFLFILFHCLPLIWGKPNILLIYSDDVGYGDLGSYGATVVKTPKLDQLAAQGTRFTNAHASASVCSPSRFALMTGVYAWRPPGLAKGILAPTANMTIAPDQLTVAKVMKTAGYATGLVGKWHLGLGKGALDFNGTIAPGPKENGFDYSFIIPTTNDRIPCVYLENGRVYKHDAADPITIGGPGTPTGASNPEMLFWPTTDASHAGTICHGISRIGLFNGGQAARWKDEEMIDTLTTKAIRYLEDNRSKPFFLFFSPHNVHEPRRPHPRFRGKSGCGTRCDALMELDWSVGELMATLDRLGLSDSTLVLFSSDNGPSVMQGYDDGSQANLNGHTPSGPLRGSKTSIYEGGSRIPFLARWPGNIPAGAVNDQLVTQQDLLATFAALTNTKLPGGICLDSRNILPTLKDAKVASRTQYIVQNNGGADLAFLSGDYKFIRSTGALFNLRTDLAESKNLATTDAARAGRLRDSLTAAQTCIPTPTATGARKTPRSNRLWVKTIGTQILLGRIPQSPTASQHH